MIEDANLRSCQDYRSGQVEAARCVLIELTQLCSEYRDHMLVIGGWVPELMFPGEGHIGSIDVDVLLDHANLQDAGYATIARVLESNGYRKHPQHFFSYVKTVIVNSIPFDVDVDFLAGREGGTTDARRSQHVQGIKALKTRGANKAFDFPVQIVKLSGRRPDGALDTADVRLVSVVPYFIMKSEALGRGKRKDAYDLYFVLRRYPGGCRALAAEFVPFVDQPMVKSMEEKLWEKFGSIESAGVKDVVDFMEANGEDAERVARDAYERMRAFLLELGMGR